MPRRTFIYLVLAVGVVVVGLFVLLNTVYTDWQWFESLGYLQVFSISLKARLLVGLVSGIVFGLVVWLNLSLARGRHFVLSDGIIHEGARQAASRIVRWGMATLAVVVGAFAGNALSAGWLTVWRYLHQVPFGSTDPIFGKNIAFYMFTLPFYGYIYAGLLGLLLVSVLSAAVIYLFGRGLDYIDGRLVLSPRARAHLFSLVAAFFFLKAWDYWLAAYRLVYSQRGVVLGASYTDLHAVLFAQRLLLGLAILGGVVTLVAIRVRRDRWVLWSAVAVVGVSLVLGSAYPAFIEQFVVEPDQLNKERPYIGYNIALTRDAYDLKSFKTEQYPASDTLTWAQVQQDPLTVKNVRLWDTTPLLDTYSQLQEIRLYYKFTGVAFDRYTVGGDYRQVAIAAREMNTSALQEPTWLNVHLTFTHGYGVVASPVNEIGSEGLPDFWVKNLPPESVPGLQVSRPEIYYGELTNDYAIVDTKEPEFDYPVGDTNQYTTYQGTGGIRLSSPLVKAAWALRLGSYQILVSGVIGPNAQLLVYRNITERVAKIAPFFTYDPDAYIVIGDDGRLYWMIDAYTTSRQYPFSEPYVLEGTTVNYVRNAAKVVVDAYTGKVTFYMFAPSDPLVQTYARIFPGLFQPFSAMPAGLVKHVRYPSGLEYIQAQVYARYHMDDPKVFYNQEDLWAIPNELSGLSGSESQQSPITPYYVIMSPPGASGAEFLALMPFTPVNKQNMVALMAARCDFPNYGQVVVYEFPKSKLVFGPMQIEARINQDPVISQDLTLWSQAGSQVIRGNLLVIPIAGSLVYVEPLYLQSTDAQLPELKRVIVAYGDHVVMAQDLVSALAGVFNVSPTSTVGTTPGTMSAADLIKQAQDLYKQAQDAIRAGDWATYGQLMNQLGDVLNKLAGQSGTSTGPTP